MEEIVKKKAFNKRAFISTALFVSGVSLPLSGFMNHSLQFAGLTIERHFWMSAHDVSGILFVAFAILHIAYNWRALLNYAKKSKVKFVSKEALIALAMVVLLVGLVSSHAFHIG
jgi:succinate dehydrogenase/fumarate reductase cytochrome b subunit